MKESLKIFILGIIFAILAVLCQTPGPAVAREQEVDGDNERIEQHEINNRGGDIQPGASDPGEEAVAKPAENPVRAVGASEWQQLLDQVKELKDEVKRLRDGAEIRKKLEITEEEKEEKEKKVLTAVGREYILLRKGTFEFEYSGRYSYTSSDRLTAPYEVEHRSEHKFTHAGVAEYAFLNNLSANVYLPFVYKYHRVGGDDSMDESDLGNISVGMQWQPLKVKYPWPTAIFYASYSADTGVSPFEIVPGEQMSTASGFDSYTAGVSLSKTIDPIVAFGSFSYSYNDDVSGLHQKYSGDELKKAEPGDDIGVSMGIGYALSYNVSLNMQFRYNYRMKTKYDFEAAGRRNFSTQTSATFTIGTGWRITPKQLVNISLDIGLTDDADDFSLKVRLPFSF